MRPCHEASKGLDLSARRNQRSVNPDRLTKAIRTTWPWQGTEEFLGLRAARGRVSVAREGTPQGLDPEG